MIFSISRCQDMRKMELRNIELESAVVLLEHEMNEKNNQIEELMSKIQEANTHATSDAFLIYHLSSALTSGKRNVKDADTQTLEAPPIFDTRILGSAEVLPPKARYKHELSEPTYRMQKDVENEASRSICPVSSEVLPCHVINRKRKRTVTALIQQDHKKQCRSGSVDLGPLWSLSSLCSSLRNSQ